MLARFFTLFLLALVPLACNEPGSPAVRIAVIGDSLSDGVNPETAPRKLGRVHMLDKGGAKHAALQAIWKKTEIRNYSISGSTAGQWNSEAYLAKAIAGKPHLAVVYLGANDVLHAIHGRGFTEASVLALSNDITGILTRLKTGVTGVRCS
jgi:lysophospholipase L1-like esterase